MVLLIPHTCLLFLSVVLALRMAVLYCACIFSSIVLLLRFYILFFHMAAVVFFCEWIFFVLWVFPFCIIVSVSVFPCFIWMMCFRCVSSSTLFVDSRSSIVSPEYSRSSAAVSSVPPCGSCVGCRYFWLIPSIVSGVLTPSVVDIGGFSLRDFLILFPEFPKFHRYFIRHM